MKKKSKILFYALKITLIILLTNSSVYANNPKFYIPKAPQIDAKSYIVIDHNSQKVLAEKNANEKREPASLTKLMTSYVAFNRLKENFISLDDKVTISEKAWRTGGSKTFIEVDSVVKFEDLLMGMIVQSGNDASVAIAEHIAGSEETFVLIMNEYAQDLGMYNTNFTNSSGLSDKDQYTTAKDMSILASAIIYEFPDFYKLYSTKEFTYNNIKQKNRNKLLFSDKTVDGLKTGYTKKAGYCLIVSADRLGMRAISVVLGSSSANTRFTESQKILNYAFRFFETSNINNINQNVKIYKSKKDNIKVGTIGNFYVTLPRNQLKFTSQSIEFNNELFAPIKKGDKVGKLNIEFEEEILAEVDIFALESAEKANFVSRTIDSILLLFK